METEKKEITREMAVIVAKEVNAILAPPVKISVKASVAKEVIQAGIENAFNSLVTADDFITTEEKPGFSPPTIEYFTTMGLILPEVAQSPTTQAPSAETILENAKSKGKGRKKGEGEKAPRFTRSDAAMVSITELCIAGATLSEIVDRTDAIYVSNGGNSIPDAINVNKYCINGLVHFGILSIGEGKKYTFTEKGLATIAPPATTPDAIV